MPRARSSRPQLAPFVLSKPWWLVGASRKATDPPAPAEVPWDQRRLLFFAGHVPKLYIAPTRYHIWKQIRRHPGVTALSATINCTIGSFSVCRRVNNMTLQQSRGYCADFCASHVMDDYKTFLNDAPGHVHPTSGRRRTVGFNLSAPAPVLTPTFIGAPAPKASAPAFSSFKPPKAGRCVSGIQRLKKDCRHYKHIDYDDELKDMARSTVNLPSSRYFQHAMGHKFCVAAPGDFVST